MGWKYNLYSALPIFVFLILGVPAALIYSGNAEPYVEASQMPVHAGYGFIGLIGSVFATAIFSGILVNRSFVRTGKSLGLSKEGGGLFGGPPNFVGEKRGRPVRVETWKERHSSGGEGGTSTTTHTRVLAELDRPMSEGFILIEEGSGSDADAMDDVPDEAEVVPVGDGYAVIGAANEPIAREILTQEVDLALQVPGSPDGVTVGDPAETILDALPEDLSTMGGFFGNAIEERLREEISADPATVSDERRGLPLVTDRLEARIDAMVTVAEAVDAADAAKRRTGAEQTTGDGAERAA
ncbi:hypothetical protein L593_02290 [Salinarchaeum sp. Harcht-Bsk1]|uniref:hypothetical protein n=1 Tax=Salinarchaeum sp. Harcht-Bsk1 TaxID=1333523 RepID=UPI00034229F0|nr:hypothetical protein [Salinarchaeum sp. Harcht-Bsk1]AGN00409.1 hypothetical protein L593_02290 [Salinarchaeum sp. Harcht-Bsk1]